MNELNELGRIIFLERYAAKDLTRQFTLGDTVVYKDGRQKKYGSVTDIGNDRVLVEEDSKVSHWKLKLEVERLLETTPEQTFRRVSKQVASIENNSDYWESKFFDLMQDWKFVPGGRILAGMGVNGLSAYNCHVLNSPKDSRHGIMETLEDMVEIMSRGGGVGINLSTLRPQYSFVKGVNGRSSGAVSWGGIYSYATGLVEQGGCIAGDTLIPTANGTHKIKDLVGTNPWVYSYDLNKNKVVARQAKWVDKTGHKKTITIKTDKGLSLTLTLDHKVLMRDGQYVEAGKLKIGQRIMPYLFEDAEVISIELADEIDVYDMEVPDTHNFAVASGDKDSDGGVFISNSRRGALMLMLADWHPDVLSFIDAKREAGKITNANISVTISDAFMQAVKEDKEWLLQFPDTSFEKYDSEWNGILKDWTDKGYPVITYQTLPAKELYNKIIASGWASAEPGVVFMDRVNNMSNSWYFDKLIASNPCSEQMLPGWGVCLLGAMNLVKYVRNGVVLWEELHDDIQTAIRFLDNVVDATPYFFDEIEAQQKKERRIGLSTMGLADMFIKLGLRYGSDGSIQFISKLYRHIVSAAYSASSEIALEKGSFPAFNAEMFLQSGYMKNMAKEIPELESLITSHGMRNVTLLTQAPTGSTGTMVEVSSGMEPNFAFEYERTSRLGKYIQKVKVAEDWSKEHPGKPLPEYFVTAMDLAPEEHIEVLGAIQYWIDSAISKTCNVPNDYTVEQVAKLYHLMYDLGAKGGTIYRDGSRSEQVLNLIKEPKEEPKVEVNIISEETTLSNIRQGQTVSLPTQFGTLHLTANFDAQDQPVEVFINVGKAGSDLTAIAEGFGRLISHTLQIPSSVPRDERYQQIIAQLSGIGGSGSYGFGAKKVASFPDAVSKAMTFDTHDNLTQKKVSASGGDRGLCPECGNIAMIRSEGCTKCLDCGYSKC